MKTTRCAALLFILMLTLAACGDDTEPQQNGIDITIDEDSGSEPMDAGNSSTADSGSTEPDSGSTEEDSGTQNDDMGTQQDAGTQEDMGEPESCGNGVLDDGETCDGDCPSTCDDSNACTEDMMTGSPDTCDVVCTNTPNTACDAFEGTYAGTYSVLAEEKIGSSVVNSVSCAGNFDVTVDLAASNVVDGTSTCIYNGSLGGFQANQTATITGGLAPDGTVDLLIVHDFGTQRDGRFNVDGQIANGELTVDDVDSFLPNSMSAVPWETTIKLNVP